LPNGNDKTSLRLLTVVSYLEQPVRL